MNFIIKEKIWKYSGNGGWYFITIPKNESQIIKEISTKNRWGSVPITANIGKSSWKTSVFRDTKINAYLLPIKKEIRIKENISDGDRIELKLIID